MPDASRATEPRRRRNSASASSPRESPRDAGRAPVEHHGTGRQGGHIGKIVGDDDQRQVAGLGEPQHVGAQAAPGHLRVERRERFVEKQDRGLARQRQASATRCC